MGIENPIVIEIKKMAQIFWIYKKKKKKQQKANFHQEIISGCWGWCNGFYWRGWWRILAGTLTSYRLGMLLAQTFEMLLFSAPLVHTGFIS